MTSKPELPKLFDQRPKITVIGVGGAGGNAINNMIASGLDGVDFVAANTDAQALAISSADQRLQLGVTTTEGLGAGADPDLGRRAAEEVAEDVRQQISGSHMVFVAAGMGGGTGTGAAPVIAQLARECGALTVAIVSKPFHFEGSRRMRVAEEGIEDLRHAVDTLIVIPNQNLFKIANERTTFAEAFVLADQVLYSGIACIVDLIMKDGLINLDFADVRAVMSDMGGAVMGTGEAEGDQRAVLAAEEAINNPLLDDVSLADAEGVLISIIGGPDMTLYEVDEAASRIRQEVDQNANIIVGATFEGAFANKLRVSLIAAGMDRARFRKARQDAEGQPSAEPHAASEAAPTAQAQPTHVQSAHGGPAAAGARGGDVVPPPLPISQLPRAGADGAPDQNPPAPAARPVAPPTPPPQATGPGGHLPGTDRAADFSRALSGDDQPRSGQAAASSGHSLGQTRGQMPGQAHNQAGGHGSDQSHGRSPGHWQSPEGVRIEPETAASWRDEGAALPMNDAPAQPPAEDAPVNGPAHAPVFEPAMPHEARGETPRFPTVKEFPPVAQREYEAKANRPEATGGASQATNRTHAAAAQAPAVPHGQNVSNAPRSASPGLISRLTGRLGRGESDAEHDGQDERNVSGTDPNARRAKR